MTHGDDRRGLRQPGDPDALGLVAQDLDAPELDPVVGVERAYPDRPRVVEGEERGAHVVRGGGLRRDEDVRGDAAAQGVVGVGYLDLDAVRPGRRVGLLADEADGPGEAFARGELTEGLLPDACARDILLGDLPDQQHRVEVDQGDADGARLGVVADLDVGDLDHAVERGAYARAGNVQFDRLEPGAGRRQACAGRGDGRLRLEALRLQSQAAPILDVGLPEGRLRLHEAGGAVVHRQAAQHVAGRHAIA